MKLELSQVQLKGFGGTIGGENVTVKYKFAANFSGEVAKKLGIYDACYDGNRGAPVLRRFKKHECSFGFENADVSMFQDMNVDPFKLRADARNFTVVQKDDEVKLTFQVAVPLGDEIMEEYARNQLRTEAPKFIIEGRQKELNFEPPEEE